MSVPNKLFTRDVIANFNHKSDKNLRVRIRLGLVPTWENVTKGEEIVTAIAKSNEKQSFVPRRLINSTSFR